MVIQLTTNKHQEERKMSLGEEQGGSHPQYLEPSELGTKE